MSRALVAFAVAGLLLATACSAAASATGGVRWTRLASGTTAPTGEAFAAAHLAVTPAGERAFASRLDAASRAALTRVDLRRVAVVAVFLDGAPCATKVAASGASRAGSRLTVVVDFTRAPVGMATCVRTSTPYLLLGVLRSSLGRPVPTHVVVDAVPRP